MPDLRVIAALRFPDKDEVMSLVKQAMRKSADSISAVSQLTAAGFQPPINPPSAQPAGQPAGQSPQLEPLLVGQKGPIFDILMNIIRKMKWKQQKGPTQ